MMHRTCEEGWVEKTVSFFLFLKYGHPTLAPNINCISIPYITRILYNESYFPQNRPSARHHTVPDCTESSPTMSSATLSGTVGEARPVDTNVLRVWLTTANPEYACGLIKYLNAK